MEKPELTIEQMVAKAKDFGRRHPEFIQPDSDLMKECKTVELKCKFCSREFEREQGLSVHQCQCKKNPQRKTWKRADNISSRTPSVVTPVATSVGQLPELVQAAWSKYLLTADESMNINQLSRDFLKKLVSGQL